ncbi:hypothetical protein Prum_084760 [Phytohabitans rumicis]|uniref:Uncharacterized protein n=1 Tax=Phytohabitans rumicis TaxID=1076125 RepID=A0A6V8LEX7_9ACTN|nr:hypothetical protein Prum_084760 [Phytohabitans rumicis]
MRHGDRLQPDPAAGREEPVQGREVGGPVAFPDGLDHLDAEDGVERLRLDVPVVAQVDGHPVGDAGRGGPAYRQVALRGGDGDGVHQGAAPGGADGQLAPAGADFEYAGAGADLGPVQQAVDLPALGVAEIGRRRPARVRVEQRRRVRHRLVEEEGEEVVGQVIVMLDVAPRTVHCVLLGRRDARAVQGTQRGDVP